MAMARRAQQAERAATAVQRVFRGHSTRHTLDRAYQEFAAAAADIEADIRGVLGGYKSNIGYKDHRSLASFWDELDGQLLWPSAGHILSGAAAQAAGGVAGGAEPAASLLGPGGPGDGAGQPVTAARLREAPLADVISEAERLEQSIIARIQVSYLLYCNIL
jgi:hypothetical protein